MRFPKLTYALSALALMFASAADAQLVLVGAGDGRGSYPAIPASAMTFTYGNASDTTAQTTYTFTSQAVGSASANRVIMVAVAAEATTNATVTGVSICGTAASVDEGEAVSSLHILEIWSAVAPTGTSCTISFTLSTATSIRAGIGWVAILGSTQTAHSAIADANTKTTTATSITSGSLSIPTNGFAFVATRVQNAAGAPFTWSQSSGTGLKHTDSNIGVNLSMGTYGSSFTISGASTFTAANNAALSLASRIAGVSWAP